MKSIFLQTGIKAAEEASKILQQAFTKKIEITNKSTGVNADWVTKYDLLCQKKIVSIIEDKFPDHDILGEENLSTNKGSKYRWIIDPLDGTSNFSHGIPYFSVSIALNYEDKTLVGVVALPCEKKIVWAEKDRGAFCNNKKISVSNASKINEIIISLGLIRSTEGYKNFLKTINEFSKQKIKFRSFGSIATDLARVAMGQLDGTYIHNANPWDVAAGLLLVEEAGGSVEIGKTNTFASNSKVRI